MISPLLPLPRSGKILIEKNTYTYISPRRSDKCFRPNTFVTPTELRIAPFFLLLIFRPEGAISSLTISWGILCGLVGRLFLQKRNFVTGTKGRNLALSGKSVSSFRLLFDRKISHCVRNDKREKGCERLNPQPG